MAQLTKGEGKTAVLTVRLRPSVKALLEEFATGDGRSLANFLERLIVAEAERRKAPKD